ERARPEAGGDQRAAWRAGAFLVGPALLGWGHWGGQRATCHGPFGGGQQATPGGEREVPADAAQRVQIAIDTAIADLIDLPVRAVLGPDDAIVPPVGLAQPVSGAGPPA